MRVLITGDYCPVGRGGDSELIGENSKFVRDFNNLFKHVDYRISNLECPISSNNKPLVKSGPNLKAEPENAFLLSLLNFDIVTLANNHIMDFGSEGLKSTLNFLKTNSIDYVGAGYVDDVIDVVYKEKDGLVVGIVNVCENEWSTTVLKGMKANGFDAISMFHSIRKAKSNADKVIVIHHGGHELSQLPSPRLKKVLRYFVDCGADAVVNHHTHCIGPYETYNGAPIFYSTGNFIFDNKKFRNSIWNYGLAVELILEKEKISFEIHYLEQFNDKPTLDKIKELPSFIELSTLNQSLVNDHLLEEHFNNLVSSRSKLYNSYIEPVKSKYIIAAINRRIFPSFWHSRKKVILKNLISCESHRELLLKLLENEIQKPN